MLMRKTPSYAEVYNDRWGEVVDVFRTLRDPELAERLEYAVRFTPYSRTEFETCDILPDDNIVERARKTIFRSWAGFGSAGVNPKHSTGFRSDTARAHGIPAHNWAGYPDCITSFTHRLSGVVIENRPAVEVIQSHDRPDTLFYCDPPYPHGARYSRADTCYAIEMSDEDHRDLAATLHGVSGMVIVSGYQCGLYDEIYEGWARVDAKANADGGGRIESLWISPSASRQSYQAAFRFGYTD